MEYAPVGVPSLKRNIPLILEDADNTFTTILRQLISDLWEHWKVLDKQVSLLQQQLPSKMNNVTA
ncbi:hypothetical protein AB835_13635 [Candidatus Endobugula sertula]|uniref:Uncharacterized protein n=1 Tax=Candidatus Endobugula sertula TaxID=62101 RepID=A0A1D2QLV6_9GAMM|nr:hypothetical protein AB835_13635 [Candidatus Endobugula sertula]